jgi:hypothetical protein
VVEAATNHSKQAMRKYFWLLIGAVGVGFFLFNTNLGNHNHKPSALVSASLVTRCQENYGEQVENIADTLQIPAVYIKALIILECSAKKPASPRFEPKVFEKLQAVRDGKEEKYSGITTAMVKGMSDKRLEALATSWGPLQIMGYHTLHFGWSLQDLTGDKALYYGMLWCKKNYARYLDRRDYRNAFHYHNTGKPHPVMWNGHTHDPDYVAKGLAYIRLFEQSPPTTQAQP